MSLGQYKQMGFNHHRPFSLSLNHTHWGLHYNHGYENKYLMKE